MIGALHLLGLHARPLLGAALGAAFYFAACALLRLTDPALGEFLRRRARPA